MISRRLLWHARNGAAALAAGDRNAYQLACQAATILQLPRTGEVARI
jgi:hypothetical protein